MSFIPAKSVDPLFYDKAYLLAPDKRGGKPYAIPAGASEHKFGGLGFANWAYEVEQQERELGIFFDTIVVCSVTGSTHAGMIAGFAGQDRPIAGHVLEAQHLAVGVIQAHQRQEQSA